MARLARLLRNQWVEHFDLQTDVARALRALVAFAVPLVVFRWLNRPTDAIFISTTALNLSLPDLRGAYRVRLSILATMTLVAASSALLGLLSAMSPLESVVSMGIIALFGGVWRHLSADYGPSMAVSSALLFLLGLSQPGGWPEGWHLAESVGLGGSFAALLHVCSWLVHPQHALRYAVAETWVAASDLVAAMRPATSSGQAARPDSVAGLERELRATLDRTFLILGAAENGKQAVLLAHLEAMRREVVHLTMRIIAFNTSLEPLLEQPEFGRCLPVLDSVLKALSDAARSVAITLIMHRPENFAASTLRLRRCQHLVKALDEQIAAWPAGGVAAAQVRATLDQLGRVLPGIQGALGETADHAGARLDFATILPDISARSLQSLGSWMRPASRPDPVLLRHSVRMAVFTMFAVALYKGLNLPRGYWIAFTIMVVLQPDYGSTRQRAGARIGGTVAGSVLAGALLRIQMPVFLLDDLAALTAFIFAYFLKRRYGLAIFFVTINLVLITETLTPVHRDFMVMRIFATLLGGGLALVAARIFWPIWEGQTFRTLMAAAIRANREFLQSMSSLFGMAGAGRSDLLMAKRRAENANRYVAASVERLRGEPVELQENPQRAAVLATYNQRVTRALTVLAVQLPETGNVTDPAISALVKQMGEALENLARVVENGCASSGVNQVAADLVRLERETGKADFLSGNDTERSLSAASLTWVQLAKTLAEIRAMTLALLP